MLKFGTLRLTFPFTGVVLRTAALLILAIAGSEAMVRIPLIQAQFLLPILPGHYELGAKEYLAERLFETSGRIDCFFIGNSIVGRGAIPEDFSRAYQAQTGQPITCFNFGVDTLTFQGGQRLAEILVKRYHPRLIIYGVHYENFTASGANAFNLDTPWARSQLGRLSLEGWLESNLLIYRDALTGAQSRGDLEKSRILTTTLSAYGYRPSDIATVPDKLTPGHNPEFFAVLDTLDVNAHRADLDALLTVDGQGTRLILVDMPIPSRTSKALTRSGYDYQGYLDVISGAAQAHRVVFIPAIPDNLIPEDGYQDPSHMNTAGASAFSVWLGEQIGQMDRQGALGSLGQ